MANERLRAAMERRRTTVAELATAVEVDPKTVGRWLGGRVPHPRHRWRVSKILQEDEAFLWPGVQRRLGDMIPTSEVVAAYPFRSKVPTALWWDLITCSRRQIDLLGYTLYFLPLEHPRLVQTLEEKCADGCSVRAVIADPESPHVAGRDAEEDLALTLIVRIKTALKYFEPLFGRPGFEMRFQDLPLYNSVFRFDDNMFVTPHLYATPGAAAPLLHLRRLGEEGIFSRFAEHFDHVWATTIPLHARDV